MFDAEKTGKEIKRLRKGAFLTQSELAEKLMVSCQAVSNWERGVSPPDIDNLIALSEFFGVKIDGIINPAEEECFVAVDGGGTKTEFLLITADGRVLNRVVEGASNPFDIGMEECRRILIDGINRLTLKHSRPSAIYIGIAGAGLEQGEISRAIGSYIIEQTGVKKVKAISDTKNLFALTTADIVLICGTGVVITDKTNGKVFGGWGYLLDGAGSGYDVGREALSAAFAYNDGIGEETVMLQKILGLTGKSEIHELLNDIYGKGKRYIASFAPVVIEAYREGDAVAERILRTNMERIARLIQKMTEETGEDEVFASGGLINNNREILLPMIKEHTGAKILFSDFPPVFGACRECIKLAGIKESESFSENFTKTYGLFKI